MILHHDVRSATFFWVLSIEYLIRLLEQPQFLTVAVPFFSKALPPEYKMQPCSPKLSVVCEGSIS